MLVFIYFQGPDFWGLKDSFLTGLERAQNEMNDVSKLFVYLHEDKVRSRSNIFCKAPLNKLNNNTACLID